MAAAASTTSADEQVELPSRLEINRTAFEEMLKRRFFYAQAFEIYGAVAGLYDYGPPGCALKANLLSFWRQHFVLEENMLEVDCTNLTPEPVLRASGHVERFTDLMVRDTVTNQCYRADHLLKDHLEKLMAETGKKKLSGEEEKKVQLLLANLDDLDAAKLDSTIKHYQVKAPETGNAVSEPFPFNLMFATQIGPTGLVKGFLRPETAQGIFVNFPRLLDFNGGRLPFAAAQIGTAFRNEIAPRSGLLRVREFALAEIEHFCKPTDKAHPRFATVADLSLLLLPRAVQQAGGRAVRVRLGDAVRRGIIDNETLAYFLARTHLFLLAAGAKPDRFRFRQHLANEMAHYAKDCWDAELLTSYGWVECVGHADRECFDLNAHADATGKRIAVYEAFKEPQVVETLSAVPNKAAIGQKFKGDAKAVLARLEALNEVEIGCLQDAAAKSATGTCQLTLTAGAATTTVELNAPEHVKFERIKKKVTGVTIVPGVIEPSFGIGRIIYAILEQSYYVRDNDEQRGVLSLSPVIAPVRCSVLPLSAKDELLPYVRRCSQQLTARGISNKVDDSGAAIGRRYARTDEIGIPFGITVDFDSADPANSLHDTVTLRERDSMAQIRVPIAEVAQLIDDLISLRSTWTAAQAKYPAQAPPASS